MTIYLIRHASAGVRSSTTDDVARPLDDTGRDQAEAVADRLAATGIERILSSEAVRCVQTVEPLATALGLHVETEPSLFEGQSPRAAIELVERLAAAGLDVALCSHGDMIPSILNTLADSGVPLHGSSCAKGSVWELRAVAGQVVEASYQEAGSAREERPLGLG